MSPKRRAPSKSDLAQLQKLYKTDEKIGERLGGVPAYLVAYWRRKKHIAKHSQPKFSEKEILTLWERFGDDDKCGLELGISKAAFYNWRRRYGIRQKPDFLKLEQLELNLPGVKLPTNTPSLFGQQTIAQKILAKAAGIDKTEPGQEITVEPHLVVIGEKAGLAVEQFRKAGVEYVWNPNRIVMRTGSLASLNGNAPERISVIRDFAKKQGIKRLFDAGEGAIEQLALEHGHVLPGQLDLAIHASTAACGAMGCLAMPHESDHMGQLIATGKARVTVPQTIYVDISGRRPRGLTARDIELDVIRLLGDAATGKVIELSGTVVSHMTLAERITIAELAQHLGGITALCPFDSIIRRFLTGRGSGQYQPQVSDKDASYDDRYQVNVDNLTPKAALLGKALAIKPVAELEGTSISQVIVGTNSNGRFEDLRLAADLLKNKKVNADCRTYICPATRSVYLEALKKGLIRIFVDAGAVVLFPGTDLWAEKLLHQLPNGERCLTTAGRVMHQDRTTANGDIYLASVATAVVSAINGAITDPTRFVR